MNCQLWEELLQEAGKNKDGAINFEDFSQTMNDMVRKSWLRRCDRSPSKSPVKKFECSPDRENGGSPTKGLIISPERNPFNRNRKNKSPSPKKEEFSIRLSQGIKLQQIR